MSPFLSLLPPSSQTPLLPIPSGHHHTALCVHGLYTYVLWLIPSPSFIQLPLPADNCQSVSFIHASVSIWFVSLICSLDSTHKWDHMVFVFKDRRAKKQEEELEVSICVTNHSHITTFVHASVIHLKITTPPSPHSKSYAKLFINMSYHETTFFRIRYYYLYLLDETRLQSNKWLFQDDS